MSIAELLCHTVRIHFSKNFSSWVALFQAAQVGSWTARMSLIFWSRILKPLMTLNLKTLKSTILNATLCVPSPKALVPQKFPKGNVIPLKAGLFCQCFLKQIPLEKALTRLSSELGLQEMLNFVTVSKCWPQKDVGCPGLINQALLDPLKKLMAEKTQTLQK